MNATLTRLAGLFARVRSRVLTWLRKTSQSQPAALTERSTATAALPAAPVASAPVASTSVANASVANASVANASVVSAPIANASVVSAPVASASVVSAPVASLSTASASVASVSDASASVVADVTVASLSLDREAAQSRARLQRVAPASAPAGLAMAVPGEGKVGVPVRQFFARMASAGPGGLVVDFAAWGPVPVERFFMALGAAERGERRGPALAETSSIGEAFEGFVWD
jgi:hypothetical protein